MPTFFTNGLIIFGLQIGKNSDPSQNDDSNNIDGTSDKADGNPRLCSLVAGLRLIVQI